ncbi:MAG: DUF2269 family protein, partial [Alphaproteobacteria bacterium]
MWLEFLRWLHIIGASVLLGTGAGIAFFLMMAHRTGDASHIARTARTVVIADFLFTASAVVVQPVTGVLLAWELGWSLTEGWIVLSLGLYVFVGLFWLPVVWIQHKMRDLAQSAAANNTPLPERYYRLYRVWFLSGFPAFFGVLLIFWLMTARP